MPENHIPEPLPGSQEEIAAALANLRAADVAESLNLLPPETAAGAFSRLPFDLAVQVLDEPKLAHETHLLRGVPPSAAAQLIEAMSADQRADLFRELEPEERERLIPYLAEETHRALDELLRYPAKSAGGIMTTEVLTMPTGWTVEQALQYIQEVGRVKETVYAAYLLDDEQRLQHVVSLRELMAADRGAQLDRVGDPRAPISVEPFTDREEVARIISKYNLLALPVTDSNNHVIGVVTVDDVIDVLLAEQSEDVQKFGGMEALEERYTDIPFPRMVRKRAGWLTALFLGEMLTASVMAFFETEIEAAVVLALFIPLIISSGGNSGSQATSLIIRAMALREISLRDWWRVALRELPAGVALGTILGLVGALRILLWDFLGWYDYGPYYWLVAITIALALLGVVTFGSLAGALLPFIIRRLGFDPASASAPFVATLVDVTGLVIYFTVAYFVLRGTVL